MKIALTSDRKSEARKQLVIQVIEELGHEVVDYSQDDLVEAVTQAAQAVREQEADRGILLDEFGSLSYMVAAKQSGIVCAQVSDEHSSKMTRDHNNSTLIAMGTGIIGDVLAKEIVSAFLHAEYSGGRHQIRVDMLNKLA
ncbi:RpiB/LacA/LacB family sugar-phosphate isomerase [Exiguobacterium sp. SH0S1]|uniref:RpiB/LacA/LacB family sugar-phosphate isomerase n=1 Tax=Exiguobacterium sp. SH0S1 TaxID=2510949 RepID=UPI00103A952C|nr:RpiB/LacA/LacB family sugar-phosphate isomerase [Exiguobacterium sp. SH0S1]TCI77777.1 RpiB/LacA/LacB family sugar-phosphate isomerase [Exiguobacterium sp. SH0S1]